MKKQYTIIVLLLIWTTIMIVKPVIEDLPREIKYREFIDKMNEENLVVYERFDELVIYCGEHEEDFMKVSELFFKDFYEDITSQEIIEIAQNNTSPEWMELSKTFSLNCGSFIDIDKGFFYHYKSGGCCSLGVLYIDADNMDADEIDYSTNPSRDTFLDEIYKVNDYLYVCIYQFPYDILF